MDANTKQIATRIRDWVGATDSPTTSAVVKDIIWALAMDVELYREFRNQVRAVAADLRAERERVDRDALEALGESRDGKYRRYAHDTAGQPAVCPECDGSGLIETDHYKGACLHCEGIGEVVIVTR